MQFCLMCSETNPYFKVKVMDAVLKVRKVHIASNAYLGTTSALKENTAKYSSDLLPLEMKQYPQSFVANVDTREKPGTHWVAFYFIDDQHGEFFETYRLPPSRYIKYFEDFLNRNAAQWIYNWKHFQSLFIDICGHYCIFYIYSRCHTIDDYYC